MTTIKLTAADLAALRAGKVIERVGGPSIKIMLEPLPTSCICTGERDIRSRNGLCGNCGLPEKADCLPGECDHGPGHFCGDCAARQPEIDVVKVLVEPETEEKRHQPGYCWCGDHHILHIPRREPERDYYTKGEIDERMGAVFDQLESIVAAVEFVGEHGKKRVRFPSDWKNQVTGLRNLFLP